MRQDRAAFLICPVTHLGKEKVQGEEWGGEEGAESGWG